MVKGVRKPVTYKVEEREWKHFLPDGVGGNGYQRTFNDVVLPPIQDAKPARLDADKTAKPLTKIGIKLDPNHCFYGVKERHKPMTIKPWHAICFFGFLAWFVLVTLLVIVR